MVFWFLALFLVLFGAGFAFFGMSSERAYWYQRDPHGDPAHESTPFRRVVAHAFSIAVSNKRAPLRVAAIGVVLIWVALACLVVAVILTLAG